MMPAAKLIRSAKEERELVDALIGLVKEGYLQLDPASEDERYELTPKGRRAVIVTRYQRTHRRRR